MVDTVVGSTGTAVTLAERVHPDTGRVDIRTTHALYSGLGVRPAHDHFRVIGYIEEIVSCCRDRDRIIQIAGLASLPTVVLFRNKCAELCGKFVTRGNGRCPIACAQRYPQQVEVADAQVDIGNVFSVTYAGFLHQGDCVLRPFQDRIVGLFRRSAGLVRLLGIEFRVEHHTQFAVVVGLSVEHVGLLVVFHQVVVEIRPRNQTHGFVLFQFDVVADGFVGKSHHQFVRFGDVVPAHEPVGIALIVVFAEYVDEVVFVHAPRVGRKPRTLERDIVAFEVTHAGDVGIGEITRIGCTLVADAAFVEQGHHAGSDTSHDHFRLFRVAFQQLLDLIVCDSVGGRDIQFFITRSGRESHQRKRY